MKEAEVLKETLEQVLTPEDAQAMLERLQREVDQEALRTFQQFIIEFQTRYKRRVVAQPFIRDGLIGAEILIIREIT